MSKGIKLNFKCLVGTELGSIKVIDGFNLKEESQIKFDIGCINQIKKLNETYFVSGDDTLYSFNDFSGEGLETIYEPSGDNGNIVKFDFINDDIIVCYKSEVHILKNKESTFQVVGGIYDDFCLLRNNDFAVGGENTELTVYNIASNEKPTFTSKTPPNKALSLPAKIHMTSIAQDTENDNIVYCGTKFNTVQLYDIRSNQRKAQKTANFYFDYAVTGLMPISAYTVIAASSHGTLGTIDFRYLPQNKIPQKNVLSKFEKFKENASSIVSCMAIGSGVKIGDEGRKRTDILATTSHDRQFRIYDVKTKMLLNKMYLGKRGTCVMIDSVNKSSDEDLWEDLEKVDSEMDFGKRRAGDSGSTFKNKRPKTE